MVFPEKLGTFTISFWIALMGHHSHYKYYYCNCSYYILYFDKYEYNASIKKVYSNCFHVPEEHKLFFLARILYLCGSCRRVPVKFIR